ncbi:unnamed protein product [Amoebophrya sp. A120]|nr:unnamed protein product [Amoebophrya sp. A120]|eukprot:GSA120T00025911001.1
MNYYNTGSSSLIYSENSRMATSEDPALSSKMTSSTSAAMKTSKWSQVFAGQIKDKDLRKIAKKFSPEHLPKVEENYRLLLRVEKTEGSNAPHANAKIADELLLRMALQVLRNNFSNIQVSLDPFVAFPLYNFLEQQKVQTTRDPKKAFDEKVENAMTSAGGVKTKLIIIGPSSSAASSANLLGVLKAKISTTSSPGSAEEDVAVKSLLEEIAKANDAADEVKLRRSKL